jgi:hypothetical protein
VATTLAAEFASVDTNIADSIFIIESRKTEVALSGSNSLATPVLQGSTSFKASKSLEKDKENVKEKTKREVAIESEPAPVSKEQVEEVLNNPYVSDNIKQMMQALYQQNQDLLSRLCTSPHKQEEVKKSDELEEYCQKSKGENQQITKDNRALNIGNLKSKTRLKASADRLKAVALMPESSELVLKRDPSDMEALNLCGRLKRIWKDLRAFNIEDTEIQDIKPTSDTDLGSDQNDISVQISQVAWIPMCIQHSFHVLKYGINKRFAQSQRE